MSEKIVYIKFFTEIDKNSIKSLMNIIEQKLREETTKFVILISSSGGNVFAGVTGYNFLKGIPAEVETHNFGSAISIALVLFCAGKKRLSVPHATFLLHGVQANFQQGAALEEKQLEERLKGLKLDMENIAGIIAANTGKSEQEVMKAMLERTTLNPEEALKFGLVHEIKEPLFEKGAEIVSIQ
jgi:ATP-dependent Clp protease protease subunit